jgi:hypothetical protein
MCSPLETVRNDIRKLLHDSNSIQFPYSKKGTSVTDVEAILKRIILFGTPGALNFPCTPFPHMVIAK